MRLFFLDLGVGKRHPGLKIGNTQVQAGLEPTSHHIHVTGSEPVRHSVANHYQELEALLAGAPTVQPEPQQLS